MKRLPPEFQLFHGIQFHAYTASFEIEVIAQYWYAMLYEIPVQFIVVVNGW